MARHPFLPSALLLVLGVVALSCARRSSPAPAHDGSSSTAVAAGAGGASARAGEGGSWPAIGGSGAGGQEGSSPLPGATASSGHGAAPGFSSGSSASAAVGVGGAATCTLGRVVFGEVRTRGGGGASDEFVALFNATGAPVMLDTTWQVSVRGATDATYRAHWTGSGRMLPPFGHFLIAGSTYSEMPAPDDRLSSGLPDAASLTLLQGGSVVDALCFSYNAATAAAFDASFTCAGTVASNLPHNNGSTSASDVDASLVRRPGGASGNCVDTGDNASDFASQSPATPQGLTSPATP